jgi:hypothetical protein
MDMVSIYVYVVNVLPKRGVSLLAEVIAPPNALLSDVIGAVETKPSLSGGFLFYYDAANPSSNQRTQRKALDSNKTISDIGLVSGSVLLYSENNTIKSPTFLATKRNFDED